MEGQIKKVKKPILVPSLRVTFEDDVLHDTVADICKKDYRHLFPIIMEVLVKKPHVFINEESLINERLSETIDGINNLAGILGFMRDSQDTMQSELNSAITIMKRMADKILMMEEQNTLQHNVLQQTLDVLSDSQEGLDILKQLKEKSAIGLDEIINRNEAMNATSSISEIAVGIANDQLNIVQPAMVYPSSLGEEELGDDDDIFADNGFSEEERNEVIKQFKG